MFHQKYSVAIRLALDKANKHGLCPVVLRVTVDRKSAFYFTSHRVTPHEWDEENHQVRSRVNNAQLINALLKKLASDAQEFLVTAQLTKQIVTAKQVINSLRGGGARDDLFAFWQEMLINLKGIQHKNTLHQFASDYNKLKAFRSNLTFGQMSYTCLREFDQWMAVKLGNSINTRWKTFKNLKKLFNMARKEKRTTLYPFREYSCPQYKQTLRTFLTMDEVDRIEGLITSGMLPRPLWVAANYFLLSCYAGFRYQDLLAFDPMAHLNAERLVIATLKTGQVVSIPRHRRLNVILERLASRPGLVSNQKVNEYLKVIGGMAKIEKSLTVHVGRHTFAVTSADRGIPSDVVMKLMGHSNIKTTHIYYQITNVMIDQQMAKWDSL